MKSEIIDMLMLTESKFLISNLAKAFKDKKGYEKIPLQKIEVDLSREYDSCIKYNDQEEKLFLVGKIYDLLSTYNKLNSITATLKLNEDGSVTMPMKDLYLAQVKDQIMNLDFLITGNLPPKIREYYNHNFEFKISELNSKKSLTLSDSETNIEYDAKSNMLSSEQLSCKKELDNDLALSFVKIVESIKKLRVIDNNKTIEGLGI